MLSWKIGAVRVTRIVEMEMTFAPDLLFVGDITPKMLGAIPWLAPAYIDENGGLRLSFHTLLIDAPGLKLIVDTCIGNDKERSFAAHDRLKTPFLQHIAKAGFSRENVNAIICTHMHYDHVGWNTIREGGRWVPTFPNARYLFARTEYQHWKAEAGLDAMEQEKVLANSVQPVFDAGLATLVENDHRLSNEIQLTPTPGHTPGHVSVVIKSEGRSAIISGDIIHHPAQMAHPEWLSSVDSDGPLASQTRRRVLEYCADTPVLFIGTHFATPTAGHVRRDGKAYRFEGKPSGEPAQT